MKYIVNNILDTEQLAKDFARRLSKGDVVLLNGDLGAGKTTFTQFVFRELGVKEIVNSPTFAILKIYAGKDYPLYHFDTYRITTEEAIEAGFDEVLSSGDGVIFIEWSETIAPLIPSEHKTVNIKIIDSERREFEINE